MKHKYKSHKSIRKLKNKKHQILCNHSIFRLDTHVP